MDAQTPKCPSCGAPVLPDWDWCQLCGYDPESLMPSGWISPNLYQAEGAVTTAEPPRRRRAKKARAKSMAPATPPPLIELPDNLAPAIDPITEDGGRSTVAPIAAVRPGSGQSPSVPVSPREPATTRSRRAGKSAESRKAGKRAKTVKPDKAAKSAKSGRRAKPASAPVAAAITGDPQVYRVRATPPELIGAGILLVAAAALAYLTVRGILQVATGASTTALDNVATVVFVVVCAVVAFAAAVQGLALVRQRVELEGDELTAHNRFGRVQRVPLAEIYAIRLSQRQFATPRGLSQAIETPYLQKGDGSGFWLDALGGRSPGASPSDEQMALFEQLTAAVERRRPPRPPLPEMD